VGVLESLFGDKKARRKRRRKKAVKAVGDGADGCTDGCCLDLVVPLTLGAVAGREVAKRSRRR
jgi:hypothetical protein